jgi:FkbM family methyltransferase
MSGDGPLAESDRRYEHQMIEVLKRTLVRDSACIDIGAHKGAILRWIDALAPRGRHFAFEPLPHLAEGLRRAFPRVLVHDCALGDRTGPVPFHYVVDDPGYSGLRRRVYDRTAPRIEEIAVWCDRLDDLIPPDLEIAFIKIDVEGAEYHVMRGGLATIRRCRPFVVFEAGLKSTACYGVLPDQISDLLIAECGLNLSTMERWLSGLPGDSAGRFHERYYEESDSNFLAYPDSPRG